MSIERSALRWVSESVFMTWLFLASGAGAFVLFGFFLAQVGKFLGDRLLTPFAVVYAIIDGVALLFITLGMFGVLPRDPSIAQLALVFMILFGLAHFGWPLFMSIKTNMGLNLAIARGKRRH